MTYPRRYIPIEEKIAYHEAGHSVMAVHTGSRVASASIERRPGTGGRVSQTVAFTPIADDDIETELAEVTPSNRAAARKQVMMLFAGRLAEQHLLVLDGRLKRPEYDFLRWYYSGGRSDILEAAGLCKYFCAPGVAPEAYEQKLHDLTYRRLTHPRLWFAVTSVASVLRREITLDGERVTEIVRTAMRHAKRRPITAVRLKREKAA